MHGSSHNRIGHKYSSSIFKLNRSVISNYSQILEINIQYNNSKISFNSPKHRFLRNTHLSLIGKILTTYSTITFNRK